MSDLIGKTIKTSEGKAVIKNLCYTGMTTDKDLNITKLCDVELEYDCGRKINIKTNHRVIDSALVGDE
jgi:hypothetical protein